MATADPKKSKLTTPSSTTGKASASGNGNIDNTSGNGFGPMDALFQKAKKTFGQKTVEVKEQLSDAATAAEQTAYQIGNQTREAVAKGKQKIAGEVHHVFELFKLLFLGVVFILEWVLNSPHLPGKTTTTTPTAVSKKETEAPSTSTVAATWSSKYYPRLEGLIPLFLSWTSFSQSLLFRLFTIKFRFVRSDQDVWLALVTSAKSHAPKTSPATAGASSSTSPKKKKKKHGNGHVATSAGIHITEETQAEDSESALKLINLTKLGILGKLLALGLVSVPFAPEIIAYVLFFVALYGTGVAFAFSLGRRYLALPLVLSVSLHLPLVWILWFPPTLVAFLFLAFVHAAHTRLYLLLDAPKLLGWILLNRTAGFQQVPHVHGAAPHTASA